MQGAQESRRAASERLTLPALGAAPRLRAAHGAHRLRDQALHAPEVKLHAPADTGRDKGGSEVKRRPGVCVRTAMHSLCTPFLEPAILPLRPPPCRWLHAAPAGPPPPHLPILVEQRHQSAAQLGGGVGQQAARNPRVGRPKHLGGRGVGGWVGGGCVWGGGRGAGGGRESGVGSAGQQCMRGGVALRTNDCQRSKLCILLRLNQAWAPAGMCSSARTL